MTEPGLDGLRLHSQVEFQTWLARDLEVRDELAELMGADPGIGLKSLDAVEAFLLRRYAGPDDVLRLDQRGVLDAAARHVGLVMVLGIDGAAWEIDLTDPSDAYYRLPVVGLADGSVECPLSLVTAALDRRNRNYLHTIVGQLADAANEPEGTSPPPCGLQGPGGTRPAAGPYLGTILYSARIGPFLPWETSPRGVRHRVRAGTPRWCGHGRRVPQQAEDPAWGLRRVRAQPAAAVRRLPVQPAPAVPATESSPSTGPASGSSGTSAAPQRPCASSTDEDEPAGRAEGPGGHGGGADDRVRASGSTRRTGSTTATPSPSSSASSRSCEPWS